MFNLLWNKPKPERFSLENLKSLCEQLQQFPGDANEDSIISCLKELTQLLIWGDQHDPLLLEHFFEQNVHFHFLEILRSGHDGTLIVQVLQTLNIMFENVRSQESLYFLLSNNYVNQVICLKYDFSNDEILAYYIYLLRTLSFKLSKDTIYFFFNEHLDDFPLYSEAIKFFNHEESMIRIAVRVITLNVYSVHDCQMQDFILDRTTTTYFSNLVWFIGNYGTTINDMLIHSGEVESSRINYYLAEHMDCFYYVNDIIELEMTKINKILISHLLNRLLRPMYLDSLLPASAQGSTTTKSSSSATPKLTPLVALSLMLHAFHVLKHAPLVSALTSTLFSNQHHASHSQHQPHPLLRQSPSPSLLILGVQSLSPDSSRPTSPVTSKFHSFGLLGSSPASQDSYPPALIAPVPQARFNSLHSVAHPQSPLLSPSSSVLLPPALPQQNPYKVAIYDFLSHVDCDRLVLPALTLIYLAGRNTGVMSDVLLDTDIYPQRLRKSRLLMGNLMSTSASPAKSQLQGPTVMSREQSADSITSNHSTGAGATSSSLPWNVASALPGGASTGGGSLFGAGRSAAAARVKSRTESPLFVMEEDNKETRETKELLASDDAEPALPPTSPPSGSTPSRSLSSSLPSSVVDSATMPRYRSPDVDIFSKARSRSSTRKGSKTSSLMGSALPSASEQPPAHMREEGEEENSSMGQELRPVFTSKEDREIIDNYASIEEVEGETDDRTIDAAVHGPDTPPPLPPRPIEKQPPPPQDEAVSVQESVGTQTGPTIQNRENVIDRLMDIICGMPESGAHRFRIITIQMATELLIEFVLTRGSGSGSGTNKENQVNSAAQQAAESQLGEARLHRLALAEAQFRERVQKGIRHLERKKTTSAHAGLNGQPLGLLTGRVERSLTESKLGIDKHIVNIIAEASVIYGPDRDLDKELDLDPDPDLVTLFDLDPEYTTMDQDILGDDDNKAQQGLPTSSSSAGSAHRDGKRARIRSKIRTKMQGGHTEANRQQHNPLDHTHHASQNRPTGLQRLEAMVVRYIKWLHLLIQCRQLLCRKALTPAMALVASPPQPTVATTSLSTNLAATSTNTESPSISTTATASTVASTPTPIPLGRRPSDLMSAGSASGSVTSAHKGLQKALATTATTTTTTTVTVAGAESGPLTSTASGAEASGLLSVPSMSSSARTATDPAVASAASSTSSASSSTTVNQLPTSGAAAVSATLSQPASGTASGRVIGSRTLLSATAALEAAASSSSSPSSLSSNGASGANGIVGGPHPFINDMLTQHLDPLSASVSEAIRKSSARIKKTVVDPLSANHLFKSSPLSSAASSTATGQETASTTPVNRGFYRPSAPSSAASSVASLVKPGSNGMQRSLSASSTSTSHSATVAATTGSVVGRISEDHSTLNDASPPLTATTTIAGGGKAGGLQDEEAFVSILDPGHPAHQTDEQIYKILET
ncbi:hypothetical protein BGZ99_008858, partial [Dissophora globulifera]